MESPKQKFPGVNCARKGSDGVTRELGVGFQVGMTKLDGFAPGKASANSKSRPKYPTLRFQFDFNLFSTICILRGLARMFYVAIYQISIGLPLTS